MSTTKRLTEHDIAEMAKFHEYLHDYATMLKSELLKKYQDYLGLSAAELEAIGHD